MVNDEETILIFKSKKRPILVQAEDAFGHEIFHFMFKNGDDLRQDNLVISLFKMMDKIWNKSNLNVEMVAYDVMETGYMMGCIEFVNNSKTISDMHVDAGCCGPFKESSILNFLIKKLNKDKIINTATS